jgi:hypothetical protein
MSVEIAGKIRFWMIKPVKGFIRTGFRKKVRLMPRIVCWKDGPEVGEGSWRIL